MARFITSGGYNTEISRKKVVERDVPALAKHARDGASDIEKAQLMARDW